MEAYQERVIAEKKELDEKLSALSAFGETDQFGKLSPKEQGRMHRQHGAMETYSDVLGERIAAFN